MSERKRRCIRPPWLCEVMQEQAANGTTTIIVAGDFQVPLMKISLELYELYPKHVAIKEALRAIENAIKRLPLELKFAGLEVDNELEWMKEKVAAFKGSDAGKEDGLFPGYKPPYPATWFNKSRYLDDQDEWFVKKPRNIYEEFLAKGAAE